MLRHIQQTGCVILRFMIAGWSTTATWYIPDPGAVTTTAIIPATPFNHTYPLLVGNLLLLRQLITLDPDHKTRDVCDSQGNVAGHRYVLTPTGQGWTALPAPP